MARSVSVSPGQVVSLVERWSDPTPPVELPGRAPMRRRTRILLVALLVLATVVGAGTAVPLWTTPTPGLWFSLLFTVFIAVLVVTLWVAYAGAVAHSAARERARARWRSAAPLIERADGFVVARTVSTIEDGTVESFDLTVEIPPHRLTAAWERPTARSRMLLQTQVPGVGAPVRVWRIREGQDDDPVVVEVQDASVHPVLPVAD